MRTALNTNSGPKSTDNRQETDMPSRQGVEGCAAGRPPSAYLFVRPRCLGFTPLAPVTSLATSPSTSLSSWIDPGRPRQRLDGLDGMAACQPARQRHAGDQGVVAHAQPDDPGGRIGWKLAQRRL